MRRSEGVGGSGVQTFGTLGVAKSVQKDSEAIREIPDEEIGLGAHLAPARRSIGNFFGILTNLDGVAGLELPKPMLAQLSKDRKSWLKSGTAPGPIFVNGDLGRRSITGRDRDDPRRLGWLTKDGALEIDETSLGNLEGRRVSIRPVQVRSRLHFEEALEGTVTRASTRGGFVSWELDGNPVGFFGELTGTSYCGICHGHMVQELEHEAFRPQESYEGLTVYARIFTGGDRRQVSVPVVGKVTAQDESSITVDTDSGPIRLDTPEEGFVQVVTVPSTALAATGSQDWRVRFDDLSELVGQRARIHFNPISSSSSVEAVITGVTQSEGEVVLRYRSDEGLDLESRFTSPDHVLLSPSRKSHKQKKSDGLTRRFVGQVVDATLVEHKVQSRGYGAEWWTEEAALLRVRGSVVEQTDHSLVVEATNGERVTLDLGAFEADKPIKGFHELSAESYILVQPHGLWSADKTS